MGGDAKQDFILLKESSAFELNVNLLWMASLFSRFVIPAASFEYW